MGIAAAADPPLAPVPRPPRRSARGLIVGHTGLNVARYHSTFMFGLLLPLAVGLLVGGWRAAVAVAAVTGAALAGTLVWRRVGARGHPLRPAQLLRLGLLLAMMFPALLAANPPPRAGWAPWPILPAAGLLLVMLCWLIGPGGGGRLHPVVTVYLLLAAVYPATTVPHTVLQRNRLLTGDVLRVDGPADPHAAPDAWRTRPIAPPPADAVAGPSPIETLGAFTRGRLAADVPSVDALLTDRLPPLEDLVLGVAPGPIGTGSGVAVIVGGLFLLYRGLIDFRVPLLIVTTAWVALLVLPIPVPTPDGGHRWQWLAGASADVGWAAGVTLVNYEALASPLLFTAFFLAGSPSVRPLGRPARSAYAACIGLTAAPLQMYVSPTLGSYLALFIAGLYASDVDRRLGTWPLVGRTA